MKILWNNIERTATLRTLHFLTFLRSFFFRPNLMLLISECQRYQFVSPQCLRERAATSRQMNHRYS